MAADDPYIDPASGVLRNKFGITGPKELEFTECTHAIKAGPGAAKYADSVANLDETALKQIHHMLFHEVYDWAGKVRKVSLAKDKSVFGPVRAMHGYADREIFPKFAEAAKAAGDDNLQFADALAECWSELSAWHPFRDGNARAISVIVNALAHRYGRDIDWRKVPLKEETLAAEAGMRLDYSGYTELLKDALRPWDPTQRSATFWPDGMGRPSTGKS